MTHSIGVDLGLTGAVAMMGDDRRILVADLPVRGDRIDGRALLNLLRSWVPADQTAVVVIENVLGMSFAGGGAHNNLRSRESLARTRGTVEAVCDIAGFPLHAVGTQRWKREMGLYSQPKEAGRELALRIFPSVAGALTRKKDHNRADALLLAHYGKGHVL